MRYDPDPHFDEAFSAPDEVREPYRQVLEALEGCDLRKLSEKVSQDAADRGMTFGDDEEPFHLDPVPRIIDADEWELLEPSSGTIACDDAESCKAVRDLLVRYEAERQGREAPRTMPEPPKT